MDAATCTGLVAVVLGLTAGRWHDERVARRRRDAFRATPPQTPPTTDDRAARMARAAAHWDACKRLARAEEAARLQALVASGARLLT